MNDAIAAMNATFKYLQEQQIKMVADEVIYGFRIIDKDGLRVDPKAVLDPKKFHLK